MSVHPLDAAGSVPDVNVYLERETVVSAATRAEQRGLLDLRYGPAVPETLDVFPARPGAPLAVFIHGGFWRRRDKSDYSYVARGLAPHGIAAASINYGYAPATPLREIVAQCRRALAWLHAEAERLDVDGRRISVFGHSAGGHLAAMCAVAMPLHAVTTISGLHDLRPVQASFVNEWLCLDEREADELSPIHHAPARPVPLFATAGELESEAFKAQGRAIVDAWTRFGCEAAYAESPGDNHFSICARLMNADDPLTEGIARRAR